MTGTKTIEGTTETDMIQELVIGGMIGFAMIMIEGSKEMIGDVKTSTGGEMNEVGIMTKGHMIKAEGTTMITEAIMITGEEMTGEEGTTVMKEDVTIEAMTESEVTKAIRKEMIEKMMTEEGMIGKKMIEEEVEMMKEGIIGESFNFRQAHVTY